MFDLLPLGDLSLTSMIEQVFPQGSRFLIIVSIRKESLKNIHPRLAQKMRSGTTRGGKEGNHDDDKDTSVCRFYIREKWQRELDPF